MLFKLLEKKYLKFVYLEFSNTECNYMRRVKKKNDKNVYESKRIKYCVVKKAMPYGSM